MGVEQSRAERILAQINEENRKKALGKLKIFLGYGAGIGKTYAMLSCAQEEKRHGTDIVAGYVEPHDRPETMALVEGLEVISSKDMLQNGIILREFDLDAALRRRPKTILIDEMAHTNAAGCRHQKRYEDIEELLKAGINVYTTVNIQHIESLHDMVAGITGISVRERIPDEAFDAATQIEMVDIPPEELLERMMAGKIYHKQNARWAMQHFFTIENLTSLREIALRRLADWVNASKDNLYPSGNGLEASEHIMMCLSPSPSNPKVIRQAARMAKAFHGKFTAFYVEMPDFQQMDAQNQKRLGENIRLAEQLGANIIISYGNDIGEQIAEYSKAARVTKIVIGRTYTKRGLFSFKESFSERLTRMVPNLEIFVIPDSYEKKYKKKKKRNASAEPEQVAKDGGILLGLAVCATLISIGFQRMGLRSDNLIMVYMLGVLLTALWAFYPLTGIVYGVCSIFLFNFFFTDPKGSFQVYDPGYLITFVVMLATAIIISTLVRKVKNAARQTAEKSYRTEILLETSQKLQRAANEDEIAKRTAEQLGRLLGCNIYSCLDSPESSIRQHNYIVDGNVHKQLSKDELAVAGWTYRNNKHAGKYTTTLPGAKCMYLTIRNGDEIFGVVGMELIKPLTAFEKSVILAILNECALAFEKEDIRRIEKETSLKLQQERLRANLLRAISHDLRTPLTSISGNADILLESYQEMQPDTLKQIFKDIYEDSNWLINLVENLLSVTRIENGTMQIHLQAELVDDIVTESRLHMKRHLEHHSLTVMQDDDMLVAKMDAKLILQVLVNLMDNAVKHTPDGSDILLHIYKNIDKVIFEIRDQGDGVPDDEKEKIFALFYTGDHTVSDARRGMGMGLTLCKSIVEAHGGTIWVKDNHPRGAIFGFALQAEEVKLV